MTVTEFVENYVKENDLKLLPHHKSMLKAIEVGKMTYRYSGKSNGKSVLADALQAYSEYIKTGEMEDV